MQQQMIYPQHDRHTALSKPWLHGVTHMTSDEQHCIYWKGIRIDFIAQPEKARYRDDIHKLAVQCRHLESIGVPINIDTVVHFKHWFSSMSQDDRYKPLLMHCPDIRISVDLKILVIQGDHAAELVDQCWHYYCQQPSETQAQWSYRLRQAVLLERGYRGLPLSYSDLDGLHRLLTHFNVPVNLFESCCLD